MSAPRIVVGKLAPVVNAIAPEQVASAAITPPPPAAAPAPIAQAVLDVLELAVEHLGGLPLATTILCAPAPATTRVLPTPAALPWRSLLITTSGAVHQAAQAAGVPVFSGGSTLRNEDGGLVRRTYGELGAMALAMANERAFPGQLDAWCDAKRRGPWKLVDTHALAGLPEASVVGRPCGGVTFRELAQHYGFELLAVGVGEAEGLELFKLAKGNRA